MGSAMNSDKSVPTVSRTHKGRPLVRPGRGFSVPELHQAGLTKDQAERLKLPLDPRRRTSYDHNAEIVRTVARELKTQKSTPSRGGAD